MTGIVSFIISVMSLRIGFTYSGFMASISWLWSAVSTACTSSCSLLCLS